MNNDENLNNSFENNENQGGANPPLQEVTVETSVPEEPYPQTDVSSSVDSVVSSPVEVAPQTAESTSDIMNGPTPTMGPSPEPVATAVSTEQSSGFEDVQKKSKVGIIIAILVVVLLGVGGYFGYKTFFATTPYENAITNAFKILKNNKIDSVVKVSTNIKFDSKAEGMDFLKNYSLDYSVTTDVNNGSSLMNFGMLEKGNSILNANMFLKDDKIYVQSKELTDKTYYIDGILSKDSNSSINTDDLYYLVDVFEKALKESLKDEKPTKSDITLSLDGTSIKAKDNLYTIDKNNYKRVTENSVNVILNDEKAISILAKFTGSEASEIKKELEEAKNDDSFDETAKISVYTKGFLNEFVGFNIEDEEGTYLRYIVDGKKESLVFAMDKDNRLSIVGNDEVADIKLVVNAEEVVTGKVTTKDNESTIVINIPEVATITITMKVENNAKMESFDTTNAVSANDLTEEELTSIETNLENILKKTELYTELQSLFGSGEEYVDYNDYNSLEGKK